MSCLQYPQSQAYNNLNCTKKHGIWHKIFTKISPTGHFRRKNVDFRAIFCSGGPFLMDFSSRESYNLLNFSIKTTFSGDVNVQHHPNITLNDTRSTPYHKGLAKRVMLVRSKNKNFLVEIFLYRLSNLVQSALFSALKCVFHFKVLC